MKIDYSSRRTVEYLRKQGYYVVKSARSMGLFDVIAINRKEVILIQAKANQAPRPQEMAKIRAFKDHPDNSKKQIWIWKKQAREPIIKEVK